MGDLLGIGSSALTAYRRALDTAGHNIANVNTPGYSRQRVELASRPDILGGNGVDARRVQRFNDGLLLSRQLDDSSAQARLDSYHGMAARLDGWLSDPDTGLAKPLNALFTAIETLAASPASEAARQSLLGSADTLAARFQDQQGQFDGMASEINGRVEQTLTEINGYAHDIAKLNEGIGLARGKSGGQAPNDLLDQREQLLVQLAQRIGIRTVAQDDGSLNVFAGQGQALVLGSQAQRLVSAPDEFQSGRLDIQLAGGASLSEQLGGGTLGGLLDARRELLEPARARLGRLAATLATSINSQHAQGVDGYGQAGAEFFAAFSAEASPSSANTGSARIGIALADSRALGAGDYRMRYDGSRWTLSPASGGAPVPLSGSGSAADPYIGAGLKLTVQGTATAGDQFLLQATRNAAGGFKRVIDDPAAIAAAGPGAAAGSSDNRNAQALAALASARLLDGGRESLSSSHASLVAQIGTQSQQSQLRLDAQNALLSQTQAERDSVSGVNLDEEAADLLRFQQAYQAAAQVIATAGTVFESLLAAARR